MDKTYFNKIVENLEKINEKQEENIKSWGIKKYLIPQCHISSSSLLEANWKTKELSMLSST